MRQHRPAGISARELLFARGFDLVHSAQVTGRSAPLPAGRTTGPVTPQFTRRPSEADDFLVSVLREDWPMGKEQCRLRVTHSAGVVGSLTVVVSGPPVPLVIRLACGEGSIPYRFLPVWVDLELRVGGQAPGTMALTRFPLQPGSAYTIVIAASGSGVPEVADWSEDFEHAE
ncbi:MAG: hypothetical protein ABJC74_11155 [Gemmatimonadota bacterium]